MRIALLSESREFGGAEQYLLLLAEGLAALGYEPAFIIPGDAVWRPRVSAAPWVLTSCPHVFRAWTPLRVAWLASALRRLRPDLVHINLPSAYAAGFTAAAAVARAQGRPVVTTEHLSMVGRSRRRALFKKAFTGHVGRIIAVSDATRRCLVEEHGVDGARITVVPNGVDVRTIGSVSRSEARSRLGVKESAVVVGCVGDLIPRKGHRFLIEAMAEARGRLPADVRLVLIGGDGGRRDIERLVAETGLGDTVSLAGRVEGAGSLLRAFDVFVMPSLMEALPFALLEAMASGLPVVATSVWGIPEVVADGETGILVPPGDVGRLAEAIIRLLEDSGLRAGMGAAAASAVRERFSLNAMAAATADVYEEVVRGGAA